jgi:hypothetical protein
MKWQGYWLVKSDHLDPLICRAWQYIPWNLVADTGFLFWGSRSDDPAGLRSKLASEGVVGLVRFSSLDDMRRHYRARLQEGYERKLLSDNEPEYRFLLQEFIESIEQCSMEEVKPYSSCDDDNWDYNALK